MDGRYEEIKKMAVQLKSLCVQAKVPMAVLLQFRKDDGRISNVAQIVTPELVDFDTKTVVDGRVVRNDRRIYDISNVIQGGYTTRPEREEDEE